MSIDLLKLFWNFPIYFSCYFSLAARLIQPSDQLLLRLDKAFIERGRSVALPPTLSSVLLNIFLEFSSFINIVIHIIHNEHICIYIMITVTVTVWSRMFHGIVTRTVPWTHRKARGHYNRKKVIQNHSEKLLMPNLAGCDIIRFVQFISRGHFLDKRCDSPGIVTWTFRRTKRFFHGYCISELHML